MGVPMNNLSAYYGLKIFESPLIAKRVQFRHPRSRKRRIRRKWAARAENFKDAPTAYRVGDVVYAHPEWIRKIKESAVNL